MIACIGDVHEDVRRFARLVRRLPRRVRHVIQVGDLWVWRAADRPGRPDLRMAPFPAPRPERHIGESAAAWFAWRVGREARH